MLFPGHKLTQEASFLFPPDMREWLPPDHPAWLVIRVVEQHLGTGAFHAARRTGGAGAPGYDPGMLLAVLVWAYANGVTGWRRIEQLCGTGVAFRVICAQNLPDHAAIARFRGCFGEAIAGFFAEVLGLCARLGMGKLGAVALDGMKIAAGASKAANRTEGKLAELARGIVAAMGRPVPLRMSCSVMGAGMRCPGTCGGRAAGMSGSVRRWPACRPSGKQPGRRSKTRRRRSAPGSGPGSGPGVPPTRRR